MSTFRLLVAQLLLTTPILLPLGACSSDAEVGHPDAVGEDTAAVADPDAAADVDADVTADIDADAAVDVEQDTAPRYATEFIVVDIDPATPAPVQLTVQACAGLYNRETGGSAYTRMEDNDQRWLRELELEPSEVLAADEFIDACVTRFPLCVRYSYAEQQELLPSILTVGAALGAVPLDVEMTAACDDVAFDATTEFEGLNTPVQAGRYVYENHLADTTGLAMLNPGYDIHASDLSNPDLTRDMAATLVDFVFSERLFVAFLVNGCQPAGEQTELLYDIVNDSDWPRPVGVYGYNNSWLTEGYLHEAQTRCLESRNMGAIPTETSNLSFFSTRRAPITEVGEVEQNPLEDIEYDAEKTYVAFVIGDGDNVRYIMATRNVWLQQRLADCELPENACAPVTWSISPHLPWIAPDVLEWYYEASHQTGRDYFLLPPSGHQYAYPTSLADEERDLFVAATEHDARLLGTSSTVHWEWWDSWREAESTFLPKYAHEGGAIRGVFPINVPFVFPTFTWWDADQFYSVLDGEGGGQAVVFRPRQWRGVDGNGPPGSDDFYLSPAQMTQELSDYPRGTVTWVYMTSDGGLSLENSFMELVRLLPEHVELVSADTAARLAIEASGD